MEFGQLNFVAGHVASSQIQLSSVGIPISYLAYSSSTTTNKNEGMASTKCCLLLLAFAGDTHAFVTTGQPSISILSRTGLRGSTMLWKSAKPTSILAKFATKGAGLLAPHRAGEISMGSSSSSGIMDQASSRVNSSSWLAWWAQTILSVVSGVTIFFANAVKGPGQANILANGIFLATIGLAVSFINVFWTWSYGRSASKILKVDDASQQCRKLRKSVKLGVILALSGMLITLVGAEQIVGTMVAKAISGSLFYSGVPTSVATSGMQLQALDIFVVQANTNTLLAHLVSLVNSLYITTVIPDK